MILATLAGQHIRLRAACRKFMSAVFSLPLRTPRQRRLTLLLLVSILTVIIPVHAGLAAWPDPLAAHPPMGWNDWAHYQCRYTAQTILSNARELAKTGLAADGYNTVVIDDCWMQKTRNAQDNLQADPQRFPDGMKPVAEAVHALGLKFGIYEDAGYETCDRLAGSGEPKGGGKDHFLQDAKLFASWGVDYLKLDGCNVYVPNGMSRAAAYRRAYSAESAALRAVGRPIIFSESAPAYFQGTPEWYDVLSWVRDYGQLWREGSDMANFNPNQPNTPRFQSVLWNYSYNLPLGRFQKPGNWDDADFIIGGDAGMSLAESRSQLALWSMMSAPLILSSDISKLSPQSIAILGNKDVIAIDQDPLGRMASLVYRTPSIDVLVKPLRSGDYAVDVLNRGDIDVQVNLRPAGLGFAANANCRLNAINLWDGTHQSGVSALRASIAMHDTVIWRVHASPSCGIRSRRGAIVMTTMTRERNPQSYSRCLASTGLVEPCSGSPRESWTVTRRGAVESPQGECLTASGDSVGMKKCSFGKTQRWIYNLTGNLINAGNRACLTTNTTAGGKTQTLELSACGHDQPDQVWSLPN